MLSKRLHVAFGSGGVQIAGCYHLKGPMSSTVEPDAAQESTNADSRGRESERGNESPGRIADGLIRSFAPRSVFDFGCRDGGLVEAFWDRGVESFGRGVPGFDLSLVRPDIRPYLEQRSLADPIEGEFDLIASLGAFEGVGEHEVSSALDAMCRSGKRIVFSSEPSRTAGEGPNARPTIHWLREFAGRGFAPKKTFDASFIAPHVFVLEGRSSAIEELDLVAFANRIRLSIQIFEDRQRIVQLQHSVRDMKRQNSDLSEQIARVSREEIALTSSHAWWLVTQFWRATSYPLVREVRHGVRKLLPIRPSGSA